MSYDWNRWSPMQDYLENLHARLAPIDEGEVANYIPELSEADAGWFGIALVTVDGNVYQVGDARQPFTVQSIAKAIAYGMALEDNGEEATFRKVSVEPSGEAFNSISLEPDTGRPLNPMINAGAIATTGLIRAKTRDERLGRILDCFERYTGHAVGVNDAVYRSEHETGHRNRAISHLLRNADIISSSPEEVLDTYFRQCSIGVTARDLALMAACLANGGVNPITGVVALDKRYVDKVLSVMSTCGMYDYSGSWIFSVGMPAKSGVGGGIMAALPGQFGLGVFSPPLDAKGNSVRGIRVCEELSRDFGLHHFNVARSTSSSVLRVSYDASSVSSKRVHTEHEHALLRQHGTNVRVYELQGELMFGSTDSVIRALSEVLEHAIAVIIDFRRVVECDGASSRLLAEFACKLQASQRKIFFTGTEEMFAFRREMKKAPCDLDARDLLRFADKDRALEWCEDLLLARLGTGADDGQETRLEDQYLCRDLSEGERDRLRKFCSRQAFAPGDTVFSAGDSAASFFMIVSGGVDIVVRAKGNRERRLATIRAGMSFGEFGMVSEKIRSADARAVVGTVCYEVPYDALDDGLKGKLLVAVARELSRRLTNEARQLQMLGVGT